MAALSRDLQRTGGEIHPRTQLARFVLAALVCASVWYAISEIARLTQRQPSAAVRPATVVPVTTRGEARSQGARDDAEVAVVWRDPVPKIDSDTERATRGRSDDPRERIAAIQWGFVLDDDEAARALGEILARDANAMVREEAVAALDQLGGEAAVAALAAGLGDGDPSVRLRVIEALWNVGDETVHLLGQVLFSEPDPALRLETVQLLGADSGPVALALLEAATGDPDEAVSDTALGLLEAWGTAVATLGSNTPPRSEPRQRLAEIEALLRLETDDPARRLGEILARDADAIVREEAVAALERIGGEAATAALAAGLGDVDVAVRQRVIEALGIAGGGALYRLGEVMLGDPDPGLRLEAVHWIATNGGPPARVLLDVATRDPDAAVRHAARDALQSSPPLAGATTASEPRDEPQPAQRIEAVWRVRERDDEGATDTLREVLTRDADVHVRREALAVLEDIGSTTAIAAMSAGLGDDDDAVRHHAVEALGHSGSEGIPFLGQVLFGDADIALRLAALRLLANEGSPAAHVLLEVATKDPEEEVRVAARRLLGR